MTLPILRNAMGCAVTLMLCFFGTAQAMYVNPYGTGQVLFFPYYTVNAGQTTLLSIANTTPRAKALRVFFHEAHNARTVQDVTVYLGAYDSWTAAVGSLTADGAAFVQTADTSCTSPDKSVSWQAAGGDSWRLPFRDFDYVAANVDHGPTSLARTREGYVAVFEYAQLSDAIAALVDADGPRDCARMDTFDPRDGEILSPGGGLAGRFAIVDVAQGTLLGGNATAIDSYTTIPIFTDTASIPDPLQWGRSENTLAHADVLVNGRMTRLSYSTSAPNDALHALSATLMADAVIGEFSREASIGSSSEWVLTAPTKSRYTDNLYLGVPLSPTAQARPPFDTVFGGNGSSGSCSRFDVNAYDREGRSLRFDTGSQPYALCTATSVVTFGPSPIAPGGTPVLGSQLGVSVWNPQPAAEAGTVRLDFTRHNGGAPRLLQADRNGIHLRGLPLIGFQAIKYINGNVLPGVLANYTYALPVLPVITCANAQGEARACP